MNLPSSIYLIIDLENTANEQLKSNEQRHDDARRSSHAHEHDAVGARTNEYAQHAGDGTAWSDGEPAEHGDEPIIAKSKFHK